MILTLRLIADYFWEYKEVALVVMVIAVFQMLILLFIRPIRPVPFLLAFIIPPFFTASIVFTDGVTQEGYLAYAKIISTSVVFALGALSLHHAVTGKLLAVASIILLVPISWSYVNGSGYQEWAGAITFSGGFFFKTDLAAFLSMALSYFFAARHIGGRYLVIFLSGVLGYFTIIANARIYYLIFFALAIIFAFRLYRRANLSGIILTFFASIIGCTLAYFVASSLPGADQRLLFDTSDGLFSGRLTQGRSVFWEILLDRYFENMGWRGVFFGGGFEYDRNLLADSLGAQFENIRDCHNTYIYLLINHGLLGLILYLFILLVVVRQYIRVAATIRYDGDENDILCGMFTGAALIFIVSSMTCSSILHPQLSWPFFFFSGALFTVRELLPVREELAPQISRYE